MEFSIQSAPSGACRFSRAPSDLKYACVVWEWCWIMYVKNLHLKWIHLVIVCMGVYRFHSGIAFALWLYYFAFHILKQSPHIAFISHRCIYSNECLEFYYWISVVLSISGTVLTVFRHVLRLHKPTNTHTNIHTYKLKDTISSNSKQNKPHESSNGAHPNCCFIILLLYSIFCYATTSARYENWMRKDMQCAFPCALVNTTTACRWNFLFACRELAIIRAAGRKMQLQQPVIYPYSSVSPVFVSTKLQLPT